MKQKFTILALAVLTISFNSCSKDDEPTVKKVDKIESIALAAGYANDVYYSLQNGVVAEVPRANWDIAFSVSARSSSIIINEGSGVILKKYTKSWAWANPIDTSGYKTWASLQNSDLLWEIGAFNANAGAHPYYGWGVYNSVSHNIENADGGALYIIKLRNGTFKKLWIEKKFSSLQKYSFRYANIDGTDLQTVPEMNASGSKANYVYYSLQDNQVVADREPDATTWDILFTKWKDNTINYVVTGVLQNINTKAIDLNDVDLNSFTFTEDQFVSDINTIGWDWKDNNHGSTPYVVSPNRVFIVKDGMERNFKIVFLSFAGTTTGGLTFHITEL